MERNATSGPLKTITDNLVSTKASIRLRFATPAAVGVKTYVIEEGRCPTTHEGKGSSFDWEIVFQPINSPVNG